MTEIIEVNNLQEMLTSSIPQENEWIGRNFKISGDLIGCEYAILKMSPHNTSKTPTNEVLAYALASFIGLKVPKFLGIWTPKEIQAPGGYSIKAFSIGVLIEYLSNLANIDWDAAVAIDHNFAANVLLLCCFDRHEWGDLVLSGNTPYFIDLERILLPIKPEWLMSENPRKRAMELEGHRKYYNSKDISNISEALSKGKELGIYDLLREKAHTFCEIPLKLLIPAITISGNHPLCVMISKFAAKALIERRKSLASMIKSL